MELHVINLEEINEWARNQKQMIKPIIDFYITGKHQVVGFETKSSKVFCKFHTHRPIINKELTAKLYRCLEKYANADGIVNEHIVNVADLILLNLPESLEQIVSKELLMFSNNININTKYDIDKHDELVDTIIESYKDLVKLGYGLIIPELIKSNHENFINNVIFTEEETLTLVSKYKDRFTVEKCKLESYQSYFLLYCKDTESYFKKEKDGRKIRNSAVRSNE